jgi:thiol-disulfide isomerase/thioredoxin
MKFNVFFISLFLFVSCQQRTTKDQQILSAENEVIEVYNFDQLQTYLSNKSDKTYVVNFWATWCKPCIKELPFFEAVQAGHADKVKVILVSLDFPDKLESKLKPFIKENNLKSQVVLLDDPYENEWIPKIDSSWTGAIPATLIFNGSKRRFYERSFTEEELENEILKFTKI